MFAPWAYIRDEIGRLFKKIVNADHNHLNSPCAICIDILQAMNNCVSTNLNLNLRELECEEWQFDDEIYHEHLMKLQNNAADIICWHSKYHNLLPTKTCKVYAKYKPLDVETIIHRAIKPNTGIPITVDTHTYMHMWCAAHLKKKQTFPDALHMLNLESSLKNVSLTHEEEEDDDDDDWEDVVVEEEDDEEPLLAKKSPQWWVKRFPKSIQKFMKKRQERKRKQLQSKLLPLVNDNPTFIVESLYGVVILDKENKTLVTEPEQSMYDLRTGIEVTPKFIPLTKYLQDNYERLCATPVFKELKTPCKHCEELEGLSDDVFKDLESDAMELNLPMP